MSRATRIGAFVRVGLALALLWSGAARGQTPAAPRPELPAPRTIIPNTNDEIAYIDTDGFIRTYDHEQLDIQWVSPTAGWRDLALGDFTGDGDMEIVAIGGGSSDGRLAIYDPVVASGPVNPDNNYAGDVYWDLLFATTLPATPRLVTTGAFLAGSASIGFAVVYDDPAAPVTPDNDTRIRIYVPGSSPPDGRQWRILADNARNASRLAAGDIDGGGADELIVVDRVRRTDSELIALRVLPDGSFVRLFDDETIGVEEWLDATVGRIDPASSGNEVAAIRESSLTTPRSLYVMRYLGGGAAAILYERSFVPPPFTIFRGDLLGNGADEMFFLRSVACNPANNVSSSNPPQLFMRAMSSGVAPFEVCLDGDNAFRRGATGDLDGDGNIEVVVISRFQMRIFMQPEASTTLFENVAVASNTVALAVGNLDRNGNATTARLAAEPFTAIDTPLQAGSRVGPINVQIYNGGTTESIAFSVTTVPNVDFVTWTVSGSQTNANLAVWLDAAHLLPGGVYGANIVITAQSTDVAGSPLVIPVLVRVVGVAISPPRVGVVQHPCTPGAMAPISSTLNIVGDAANWGRTFSVTVEPPPNANLVGAAPQIEWPSTVDWITATSPTTTVPSTLGLVIHPNQAAANDSARIVLTAPVDANTTLRFTTDLHFICTNNALFLPLVAGG
jgi:hypothetical protein